MSKEYSRDYTEKIRLLVDREIYTIANDIVESIPFEDRYDNTSNSWQPLALCDLSGDIVGDWHELEDKEYYDNDIFVWLESGDHCYDNDDWQYTPDVFSWYLVSSWLGERFRDSGEVILEYGDHYYWGRTTYGQLIESDDDVWLKLFTMLNKRHMSMFSLPYVIVYEEDMPAESESKVATIDLYDDDYPAEHVRRNALQIWEIGASNVAGLTIELYKQILYWRNKDTDSTFNLKNTPELTLVLDQLLSITGHRSLDYTIVMDARDQVRAKIEKQEKND